MDWMEIVIHTTREGVDAASEVCMRAGADGTCVEDKCDVIENQLSSVWELCDESLLDSFSDDVLVKCYLPVDARLDNKLAYISAECEHIKQFGDFGTLCQDVHKVSEQDWANEWKKFFKPFKAGEKIAIKPTWESYEAQQGEIVLEIDPGMAFGTGTHETTKMCIAFIEQHIKPGHVVLDIGCGSGILGIASSLLGAGKVLCVDNDPVCIGICIANAKLNKLTNLEAVESNLLNGIAPFECDVVIVNIIADVIIALIPSLAPFLKKGTVIITSGIIRERSEDVLSAASANGLRTVGMANMGEWTCICFVK